MKMETRVQVATKSRLASVRVDLEAAQDRARRCELDVNWWLQNMRTNMQSDHAQQYRLPSECKWATVSAKEQTLSRSATRWPNFATQATKSGRLDSCPRIRRIRISLAGAYAAAGRHGLAEATIEPRGSDTIGFDWPAAHFRSAERHEGSRRAWQGRIDAAAKAEASTQLGDQLFANTKHHINWLTTSIACRLGLGEQIGHFGRKLAASTALFARLAERSLARLFARTNLLLDASCH